jgi:hypothetical protein
MWGVVDIQTTRDGADLSAAALVQSHGSRTGRANEFSKDIRGKRRFNKDAGRGSDDHPGDGGLLCDLTRTNECDRRSARN